VLFDLDLVEINEVFVVVGLVFICELGFDL